MRKFVVLIGCVVLGVFCDVVHAADRTSFGVEFVSSKDKMPFQVSENPDTYKFVTSNSYYAAGPKLTIVKKSLFFEAAAQALLTTPRMENVILPGDTMEIDSGYSAFVAVGAVVHESFTPYLGVGYSQGKTVFKGKFDATTAFSVKDESKATNFGVGVRSIIPLAKMLSIYGDGSYGWANSKHDVAMVATNTITNQVLFSENDSGSGKSRGFAIDVGLEVTPVSSFTARALVGLSRTKVSGEPESESISYTLGLFYNF